jgi:RHS repeat-associated protein
LQRWANKYLYNGKELLTDHGVNIYDYGQRMYDPVIGRFNRIDRFSEKYYGLSPYQYGANTHAAANTIGNHFADSVCFLMPVLPFSRGPTFVLVQSM